MPAPSLWVRVRHIVGRAFRETGQALDRVAVRVQAHAMDAPRKIGGDPISISQNHLSRHRTFMPLLRRGKPRIDPKVSFVAPCASLVGSVRVGAHSSIWYGAVLRADKCNLGMTIASMEDDVTTIATYEAWRNMPAEEREHDNQAVGGTAGGGEIVIGDHTNVQDGAILTATRDHTRIGDRVTIGHAAQIHSATVESNTLIGMGSILRHGARVQSFSFVAAGAVVGEGVTVPSGELWVGNPARKLRELTTKEKDHLLYQADEYVKVAGTHSHVMELGGNVPDNLNYIQNPMIKEKEQEAPAAGESKI